ncbi:CoA transferase subunit A [Amycolatopsis acidicola]|uniref:CoA transferase subunit A n=1 Tax=Amycolatopsis acidicola TaxID=2596893 RepID=A0A5N0VDN4_9PSEU|nr:CoA-transferase [Amycolatopsis acidicola]KAA9164447.1 CoA transferase subunit A [Amycolatopsis acidicola]
MTRRRSKVVTPADAAGLVTNGSTVALGGWTFYNTPMTVVREVIRSGARDLRLVSSPGAIGPDLLIAAGRLAEIATPFLTMEQFGFAPAFRSAAREGTLKIAEIDGPGLASALRAAADDLPFGVIHDLGTDLPSVNPEWYRPFEHPLAEGAKLYAVPAAVPDVALIHAQRGDEYGNLQFLGATFFDQLIARAARTVIASVDEIVPGEELRADPRATKIPGFLVDAVVPASEGAKPCGSQGLYPPDLEHLAEYSRLAATEAGRREYLERHVLATAGKV